MKILKGLEAIRKRPGMYIGDTDDGSGLLNMLWEVMANALDQFLAGRCTRIDVEIAADGTIIVRDDGPGLPFQLCDGIPMYERALTQLHSGPTLDGHAPHVHMGLRGVGVAVVNALSEHLEFVSVRDGHRHCQSYARGVRKNERVTTTSVEPSGTTLSFRPDREVFGEILLDAGQIAERLRELSWIYPKLQLTLTDRRTLRFHQPDGIRGFFNVQGRQSEIHGEPLVIAQMQQQIQVDALIRWQVQPGRPVVHSFVNADRTLGHGVHVRGFFNGAVAALRHVLPNQCEGWSSQRLQSILQRGLQLVLCVRLDDPKFGNPTADRLDTPAAGRVVAAVVNHAMHEHLFASPALRACFVDRLSGA